MLERQPLGTTGHVITALEIRKRKFAFFWDPMVGRKRGGDSHGTGMVPWGRIGRMEDMLPFLFILAVAVIIGIRLVAGRMDRERIGDEVSSKGGTVLCIEWNPFGKGWFGSEHSRIYEVRYRDALGNERSATVKTNMWAGVFWADDRIVRKARVEPKKIVRMPEVRGGMTGYEELQRENRELRQKLAELEQLEED